VFKFVEKVILTAEGKSEGRVREWGDRLLASKEQCKYGREDPSLGRLAERKLRNLPNVGKRNPQLT